MATEFQDLKPGTEIDGFTLGARVHAGAMSTVYRVTKPGVALPLVMKLPRVERGGPPESIITFETEALIAPTLKGPHAPVFVAAGDLAKTPYLVAEWIDGRSLEDVVADGPLRLADVVAIGAALADALHSLHQQDVIHLDVKPDNAVLRDDGTIVLIDYGLAHRTGQPDLLAEETKLGMGSAPYISPEQVLGSRHDQRSDLFALGAVLYELATGELPFGEPDTDVRNRLWLEPVPPSALAPEVPPWLQEIILRCLEPRAEHRYPSAALIAFDLRHPVQVALTERATRARRVGAVTHLRRFLRAYAEHEPLPRPPDPVIGRAPIVLVAVDTADMADERHAAIRLAVSRILAHTEHRLICVSVIPPSEPSLAPLVRLRQWADPLGLSSPRLTLHAIGSIAPADVIVELARHNDVDLVVLGAPSEGGRVWSQSVASAVAGRVRCSVHLVRLPQR